MSGGKVHVRQVAFHFKILTFHFGPVMVVSLIQLRLMMVVALIQLILLLRQGDHIGSMLMVCLSKLSELDLMLVFGRRNTRRRRIFPIERVGEFGGSLLKHRPSHGEESVPGRRFNALSDTEGKESRLPSISGGNRGAVSSLCWRPGVPMKSSSVRSNEKAI
jgi:hypothetical protein